MPQTLTKTGIGRPFSVTLTLDALGGIIASADYIVLTNDPEETISRSRTRELAGGPKTRAMASLNDVITWLNSAEGIP